MVSNSAKPSNDFSETTGQVWMKVFYNDHLVVGIRIYTWKGYYNDSGPKVLKHVQKVQVTVEALGPIVIWLYYFKDNVSRIRNKKIIIFNWN